MDINDLYSGVIYDTLKFDLKQDYPFVLNNHIKPAWNFSEPLFGPAFTCQGEIVHNDNEINDDIRLNMFEKFYPGCVQIISSGNYQNAAQFGDISAILATKFGAVGAILEGPTRDIKQIQDMGFKIFSNGAIPIDAYQKWQISKYQTDILISGVDGNVLITPGDYIYADLNGVIIIRKEIINQTLTLAHIRKNKENEIRKHASKINNIFDLRDKFGRW